MKRTDKFLISHKPYAVDLSTFRTSELTVHRADTDDPRYFYSGSIDAVWFRRKQGVTYACLGRLGLWAHYMRQPIADTNDPMQVLSADLDGRYGGETRGRWDGENYWGAQKPETIAEHLEILRPALDNLPALPPGFDGWWRF